MHHDKLTKSLTNLIARLVVSIMVYKFVCVTLASINPVKTLTMNTHSLSLKCCNQLNYNSLNPMVYVLISRKSCK